MSKLKKFLILDILLAMALVGTLLVFRVMGVEILRPDKAETQSEMTEAEAEAEAEAEEPAESLEELTEDAPEMPEPINEDEWNLLLVNPWNKIPEGYVEELALDYIEGYPVDVRVKEPLEEMLAACRDAGYRVQLVSVYRTHETQTALYNNAANKLYSAYPGTSEHECGFAADIIDSDSAGWSDPLIDAQEEMAAQIWLMENCQDYGFILRFPKDKEEITGILYEPWHYRYVGKEHAAKIKESGKCLEEYLGRLDYEDKERIGSE